MPGTDAAKVREALGAAGRVSRAGRASVPMPDSPVGPAALPPVPGGALPPAPVRDPRDPRRFPASASPVPQPADASSITVTIVYGKRSVELPIPASIPVIEAIPGIAKQIGVLDPTLVYGGYQLIKADGSPLDDSSSLSEQSVHSNERLTLLVKALDDQDVVYDDIVEAVGDSVARSHHPWTNENTALTSLVISCGVLVTGALCLAFVPASMVNAVIGVVAAAALIGIAAVLDAKRMHYQSLSIALSSCLLAAVGGYHVAASLMGVSGILPGVYAGPALGAGAGMLLFGGLTALLVPSRRVYALLPIITGAVLAVVSVLCLIQPSWTTRTWTIATALIGLGASALPWLSLSSARLSVDSPASEAEIFALPKNIDITAVRRRYLFGSAVLFDLRASAALLTVSATPIIVSNASPAGIGLVLSIFANMLLDSRRIYARSEMLVAMIGAGAGLCVATIACASTHLQWVPFAVTVFMIGALLCVIGTQLGSRGSIAMTRLADAADVISVTAVPPLAYLALGL